MLAPAKRLILILLGLSLVMFGGSSLAQDLNPQGTLISLLALKPEVVNLQKPLSHREISENREKLGFKIAEGTVEFFDSLNLDLISTQFYKIINLSYKIDAFKHWLKDKCSLDIEMGPPDEGLIIYSKEW